MAIENSTVLRLVARLVMNYLDEQNLTDAYNTFCETSRHISDEEYSAYSEGIKTLDSGLCLINIVKEYFYVKDKLKDFIRSCPKTSIIISLIDTTSLQSRLELVLKVLKENLLKIDHVKEEISRKRRKTDNDLFDVSQTNTSTPETVQPRKKRKLSCTKSSNNLNISNNELEVVDNDVSYISSPETSNKEDDVTDSESKKATTPGCKNGPPPELLSETLLKKPDFAENLADIINKTLAERDDHEKTAEATNSQNILTQNDVQDILQKTENDFEDILKEVIDKYLIDDSESGKTSNNDSINSNPETIAERKNDEIPLKQRLRPRTAKKVPLTERKKKKINIISNEIYTGPLPLCVQSTSAILSPVNNPVINVTSQLESHVSQPLVLVPIMPASTHFIPIQSFQTTGSIICENNNIPITTTAELSSNVQLILTENNPTFSSILQSSVNNDIVQKEILEKVQKTPKSTMQTNFLESKCKSTPRRKASHVRILNFNHTPSGRLATLKEFKTPSNSIRRDTPGSAPASIMASQKLMKTETSKPKVENGNKSLEIVDESSNSISNTPKVVKNRRRRKIAIDSKQDKTNDDISPKPMTQEEWMKMREEQKSMSVDERMRILYQQNEEKTNVKKRKTPKKKKKSKESSCKKKDTSLKTKRTKQNIQHVKAKFGAKFKVLSPRKSTMLGKSPKKKKNLNEKRPNLKAEDKENNQIQLQEMIKSNIIRENDQQSSLPKSISPEVVAEPKDADKSDHNDSNDLNRSDTVQEVANLLTNLPETILAKTNSGTNFEQLAHNAVLIDAGILMETPLKADSMSPLPNTPRFAVPLISTHQETPITKDIAATAPSILKVCDILTPSFPITPGFKITPAKSDASPSGYSSRRTDYSSCSSYYKPDESEDINQNLDTIIKKSRIDRSSQSESDGGNLVPIITPVKKLRTGSTKKVECPGALERVLSFTEESNANMVPHYNMNEEGLLSESMITTCSDDSSSSFTCSTCSTDPSSDENTLQKLNKAINVDDRDSEWQCEEEIEIKNTSLVDERTGEVRFPLRNWITPKKEAERLLTDDMKGEKMLSTLSAEHVRSLEERKEAEMRQRMANMEAIKQRTIRILKKESSKTVAVPKFKKSNIKQFKLPAEQPKTVAMTRRDQILQHNLTERPKSTPLKLIASASSRRKCLTPRKTIIMDELPKTDPTIRKVGKKRQSGEKSKADCVKIIKSPVKPERVSLENINDNAVMMHDDHPSLNISTSFHESSDDEPENTVVDKTIQEGSNTFQKTLMAQGFDKTEAKDLQIKFDDENQVEEAEKEDKSEVDLSVPENESSDEIEDECELVLAEALEKHVFVFEESSNSGTKKDVSGTSKLCAPSKLQIDGKTVKIDFSDVMDIFKMEPEKLSKEQQKTAKANESKMLANEISIDKILAMIHGKH